MENTRSVHGRFSGGVGSSGISGSPAMRRRGERETTCGFRRGPDGSRMAVARLDREGLLDLRGGDGTTPGADLQSLHRRRSADRDGEGARRLEAGDTADATNKRGGSMNRECGRYNIRISETRETT